MKKGYYFVMMNHLNFGVSFSYRQQGTLGIATVTVVSIFKMDINMGVRSNLTHFLSDIIRELITKNTR